MIMTSRLILSIPCSACGAPEGHTPECPKPKLEALHSQNHHLDCPKCGAAQVGVNLMDLYECRVCHTQYSSADGIYDHENPEMTQIFDTKTDKLYTVSVYEKKGDGNFPIDAAIEELRKQIRRAVRKNRIG